MIEFDRERNRGGREERGGNVEELPKLPCLPKRIGGVVSRLV